MDCAYGFDECLKLTLKVRFMIYGHLGCIEARVAVSVESGCLRMWYVTAFPSNPRRLQKIQRHLYIRSLNLAVQIQQICCGGLHNFARVCRHGLRLTIPKLSKLTGCAHVCTLAASAQSEHDHMEFTRRNRGRPVVATRGLNVAMWLLVCFYNAPCGQTHRG